MEPAGRRRRPPLARLAAAAVLVAASAAAAPEDPGARLEEVERTIEKGRAKSRLLERRAADLDAALGRLRAETVAAARRIRRIEARIGGLEIELMGLGLAEASARAGLRRHRGRFLRVLLALERMARNPPEAMIVQPLGPADMVRGAILLRAAIPAIEDRARALDAHLAGLGRTRREIAARRRRLRAEGAALAGERTRLDVLLVEKDRLLRRTGARIRDEARRARDLARQARDLRDLLRRLKRARRVRADEAKKRAAAAPEAAAPPPPPPREMRFSRARGRLLTPVIGRIVGLFGEATETGLKRKGMIIETGPGAQVVAPHAGQIVFAGEFRGYGQLLIIEHGEGYHSLLAGLARLDGAIDHKVLSGEPVGVMGRPSNRTPSLYLELRHDGQPIDPLPWLAARRGKVSG